MNPLQRKIVFFWLVVLFVIGIGKAFLDPYDLQDVLLAVAGGIVSIVYLKTEYHLSKKDWTILLLVFGIFFVVWDIQNPAIIGQHEWKIQLFRKMEVAMGGSVTDGIDLVNPPPTQAWQIGVSLVVLFSLFFTALGFHKEKIKDVKKALSKASRMYTSKGFNR